MAKKLKEKIEGLEEKHRVIADNLLDAIWVIDLETLKYDFITPSIEKISGYTADEFKNFTLKDRLTPKSFEKVETILFKEVPRFDQGVKVVRTLEVELFHKHGHTFWAEIRAKFIKEPGQSLKIIGVAREITERIKKERQQSELLKKLGEALAEKERLLNENKVLRGFLPICSGCKRIRDGHDRWWPLDAYVKNHTDVQITYTICPDCTEVFYDDL